ncbi:MAG: thiamine-monophosphate kinase [Phycisphaeraceae bacterium]|nr:thiamine-monophosphate kinase [Phycisphaeraceae bacterium]
MRESDLLAHIYAIAAGADAAAAGVLVGPGDDCAVVRTPGGDELLLTVDQVVEGRHFEPGTPVDLVARKAVARSISDIAAMGGVPAWGLAAGVLPEGYEHGRELCEALHRWGLHWRCPIVGGDIATGPGPLTISVTVVGRMDGVEPVLRAGARPGDQLWLTGQVGGSLESGWHLRFEPRLEAGRNAARSALVHAMIDLSDGLGRDAARIGAASGVRLVIDAAKIPVTHRCPDWRHAVRDGEDYELLMCAAASNARSGGPPFHAVPPLIGPIGVVRARRAGEAPGATILDAFGLEHDAGQMGWDHGL